MRLAAIALASMLLLAGCLGGSSQEGSEGAELGATAGTNGSQAPVDGNNSTGNATYLKNQDYNQSHVHDYWNGVEERVLLDEVLETSALRDVFVTAFWPFIGDGVRTGVGTVWFTLPNNTFVPEGTGELVVEVDATSALKAGELKLAYRDANSATFTEMGTQGAQASWLITVDPEMTDLPHASSTRWFWRLTAEGTGALMDGEFSVKVIAHKTRDIKAWPEHDDHWQQGALTKLNLFTTNGTFDELAARDFFLPTGTEDEPIRPPEGVIVPPETKVVLVKLWYALDDSAKNHANGDVQLRVKEGSTAGYYRWMWQDRVQDEQGFTMYAIEAGSGNWDSPYAQESGWAWQLDLPTGMRDPTTGERMFQFGVAEAGKGNYTMEVDAYRTIPPWLQDEIQDGDD